MQAAPHAVGGQLSGPTRWPAVLHLLVQQQAAPV
jgi:hypothetical protein